MAVMERPQPDSPYPKLFHKLILKRTRHALDAVSRARETLSPKTQQLVLGSLDYALELPEAWPLVSEMLRIAAPSMEHAGYRNEWIPYLLQGIRRSQESGDVAAEAELRYQVGILHQRQSRFETAAENLSASLTAFAAAQSASGQARALNQLAHNAYLQHRYPEAIQRVNRALELSQEPLVCAMSYHVRGMIALDHKRWREAEAWHRQTLEIRKSSGDERRTAWSLLNVAYALRGQKKLTAAIEHYTEAIRILENLDDRYHWSHAQMNLGLVYLDNGRTQEALDHLNEARKEWEKQRDLLNLAKLYTNLGLAYLAEGDLPAAERWFEASIEYYADLKDESGRLNASDGLAMVLMKQERFAEATALLEASLAQLSQIAGLPTHDYLLQSMTQHLQSARRGCDS